MAAAGLLLRFLTVCLAFSLHATAWGSDLRDVTKRGYAAAEAGQFAKALTFFEEAAQKGEPVAQFNLASILSHGEGVWADKKRAFFWYEKAANAGVPQAMHNVAVFLDEGQFVPINKPLAAVWYRRAAELGVPKSQTNLALMLFNGEGISKDPGEALKWFRLAAEAGEPSAQQSMGAVLSRSNDPVDRIQSLIWFIILSKHEPASIEWVDRIAKTMTATQVQTARAEASAWQPRKTNFPEGLISP